jgi:hypothetical protein
MDCYRNVMVRQRDHKLRQPLQVLDFLVYGCGTFFSPILHFHLFECTRLPNTCVVAVEKIWGGITSKGPENNLTGVLLYVAIGLDCRDHMVYVRVSIYCAASVRRVFHSCLGGYTSVWPFSKVDHDLLGKSNRL